MKIQSTAELQQSPAVFLHRTMQPVAADATNKTKGKQMKIKMVLTALTLSASAFLLNAQDAGGQPPEGGIGGPDGNHRPPDLVGQALDANHDGVIDADEIANAPAALRTLDKNGDGKLTPDELHPPRPDGGTPPANDNARAHKRPAPPIIHALDANHDGVIDANEIALAATALKALDKNGDGKLTQDELRPPRPQNGPGGRGDGPGDEGNMPPPGPPPVQN